MELVFPVGSTYSTPSNTNPSTILGFGTWERLKGRVCVGLDEDDEDGYFDEIGKTGGEKKHKLTIEESARHNHPDIVTNGFGSNEWGYNFSYTNTASANDGASGYTGGDQPHNNVQPYEVVGYMWIRRA